ncbi:unnamed protein product [Prorocentrum cordatum]|uniref:Uncharacterized protein n=1 Tax=Prorocentrum cordatum TaxID=2364126 RepID=A0ABN9VT70_9DINO|nr:unnamed protein product [Polarella glacialis]
MARSRAQDDGALAILASSCQRALDLFATQQAWRVTTVRNGLMFARQRAAPRRLDKRVVKQLADLNHACNGVRYLTKFHADIVLDILERELRRLPGADLSRKNVQGGDDVRRHGDHHGVADYLQ